MEGTYNLFAEEKVRHNVTLFRKFTEIVKHVTIQDCIDEIRNGSYKKQVEEIRKTNIYSLDEKYLELYTNRFFLHQAQIEDYFKIALTTSTSVQVLEYLKNSFYSMHSDDSSMLYKDDELVGFIPDAKQRKISTVLFTTSNDENTSDNTFIGGELLFNFLYDVNGNEIKIKPKAGSMLVFLSNPYFTHEVLKVIEGRRITLVQWHNAIIN